MEIKTIETVARLLGLEIVGNVFKYPLGCEEMYCDPGRFPFMVVNFAAYAKSEMAKRGWQINSTDHESAEDDSVDLYAFIDANTLSNGNYVHTRSYKYDPRDPISEANATLSAIADAVTITPNA